MSQKTLLIVDDSKVSRMMMKAIIKDMDPNIRVLEAESADEAEQKIENSEVDYFSIDLNMPGRNGIELIETLKPNHANSMFALFTANIQDSTHEKCASLGVQCVNKPITEESVSIMMEYFNG